MAEQIENINENSIGREIVDESAMDSFDIDNRTQDINEMVTNVPVEFEVGDKSIEIYSKSIRDMVKIDKLINQLRQIGSEEIDISDVTDADLTSEELEQKYIEIEKALEDKNTRIMDLVMEILFHVVNKNTGATELLAPGVVIEPEFSIDWLRDNLNVELGEQIIDAYNQKCSPGNLIKKILGSKKF